MMPGDIEPAHPSIMNFFQEFEEGRGMAGHLFALFPVSEQEIVLRKPKQY
jgi:hypothetical protein